MNTVTLILGLALVTPLGVAADDDIGPNPIRDTAYGTAATDTRNSAFAQVSQLSPSAQESSRHDGYLPVTGCERGMRHSDAPREAAPHGFGYMLVDPSGWLPNSEKRHA